EDKKGLGHTGTGTWTCMIPNRISSFFNFRGPSIPVDTACSSSLVALYQAIKALQTQDCDTAFVGGINLFCTPTLHIQMSQLGMLSPVGQCKTFDKDADGYVRGEGAGIILLKPLAQAIQDNNHIYGVIKGVGINHGGRAKTLTSPNVYAQSQVLCDTYKRANILPHTVSYIEAHGTGTPLGDPIEITSLKRAFRQLYDHYHLSSVESQCGLGTVKTNIGHLEAAAGIAGVIKVLLALQNQKLPGIVNFKELNPRIELDHSPFYIVQKNQNWQCLRSETGEKIPRRAGISSFGVGGVNAHVVIEEAPKPRPFQESCQEMVERPFHIMVLSAKTRKSLEELASLYAKVFSVAPEMPITDICSTTNVGRDHFKYRLAILGQSTLELGQSLESLPHSWQNNKLIINGTVEGRKFQEAKVAYGFSGQRSQYGGMGRSLYDTQPTFKQAIDQCAQILNVDLEPSLVDVLYSQAGQNSPLNQAAYTHPALFAVEYALYQLWRSWGINPKVVMGQDIGEYVAACVAGVFSLADGLKLIAARGRLMGQLASGSDMAVILAEFKQVAQQVDYHVPRLPLVSSVTGTVATAAIATAEYWCHPISSDGNIAKSLETLQNQGCNIFLECSPKPTLWATGNQDIPAAGDIWLSSLHPDREDWPQMLRSLGELYVRGVAVDWQGFDRDYPQRRTVALPTYPFQRRRYWVDTSTNGSEHTGPAPTDIVELLNSGNIQALTGKVSEAAQFTYDQLLTINKALGILAQQHQQQLHGNSSNHGH
ncbi:MAG: type I polyketide synthase, partial [Leptolyngbyaceae bacterium]|nr:type I polyketide synthase [Leptolyngbyaceae bacterium]